MFKILLFAFGPAGVQALRALRAAGHTISACVTHPTTQPWLASVEDECRLHGVPCSTDPAAVDRTVQADIVLSIFYRRKISQEMLGLPRLGAFNVAASQLPRYRGYFPYRYAILNNESVWGVTVHGMTESYCDGPVLHRRPLIVRPGENACDLSLRVADAAATAAVEAVAKLAAGERPLAAAQPAGGQFLGPEVPFGGAIDWHQSAAKIDSFVRALDFGRQVRETYQHLTPPAQAALGSQTFGIFRSRFGGTMSSYPPGTITRCDDQVWVQTGRGHLVIEKVVVDGADHDAARYFVNKGYTTGDTFDTSHAWSAQPQSREFSHAA